MIFVHESALEGTLFVAGRLLQSRRVYIKIEGIHSSRFLQFYLFDIQSRISAILRINPAGFQIAY